MKSGDGSWAEHILGGGTILIVRHHANSQHNTPKLDTRNGSQILYSTMHKLKIKWGGGWGKRGAWVTQKRLSFSHRSKLENIASKKTFCFSDKVFPNCTLSLGTGMLALLYAVLINFQSNFQKVENWGKTRYKLEVCLFITLVNIKTATIFSQ